MGTKEGKDSGKIEEKMAVIKARSVGRGIHSPGSRDKLRDPRIARRMFTQEVTEVG